ncbi:hypothetical protein QJQ45_002401 [Haematococcus lacustris]|nr:hypothetical protein QJQ45_002401 [Haematococcus lacustris]
MDDWRNSNIQAAVVATLATLVAATAAAAAAVVAVAAAATAAAAASRAALRAEAGTSWTQLWCCTQLSMAQSDLSVPDRVLDLSQGSVVALADDQGLFGWKAALHQAGVRAGRCCLQVPGCGLLPDGGGHQAQHRPPSLRPVLQQAHPQLTDDLRAIRSGKEAPGGGVRTGEHLIALGYTRPERLCIEGRSAGGLLMGAVTNMRPDLFAAVIMGVPFVDVVTTMSDETIPLTVIEWEEWGNPSDPAFYAYMKTYSPVDNVRPGVYPHILATGGLHDPRVGYWEPAKLVAKLRTAWQQPGPDAPHSALAQRLLLLKMEMGAGHFSVTGRFEKLKEVAFEYAFLLKVQGMLRTQPLPGSAAAAVGSKVEVA